MFKKVICIIMTVAMAMTFLAGCGSNNQQSNQPAEKKNESKENEKNEENEVEQKLSFVIGAEPETLDPSLAADSASLTILVNMFEGLTTLDENDSAIPGIAEKWDISDDGLIYTFYIRDDAKWSDGQAITAEDFAYAWKRVLTSSTGADYSYMMLPYIKNAQKFFNKEVDEKELGIKVINEKTIQVTLESQVPYMLELFSFATYFPVRKDIVEKNPDDWYRNPKTYICNGPFIVKENNFGESLVLGKNKNYWAANDVKLEEVKFDYVEDSSTALNAMEAGDVDGIAGVPTAEIPRLMRESDSFLVLPKLQSIFLDYNTKIKPLDDIRVRKALSYAINRQAIVDVITQCGETPATGVVPVGMAVGEKDFRENGSDYGIKAKPQVELAQKLLAEAGYANGEGFPTLTLKYNSSELKKKYCEAIQQMWKENLNINVELKSREWKIHIKELNELNFEIATGGWTADYAHPMAFLELFTSKSGNNYTNWTSDEYDKTIALAQKEQNQQKSLEYLHKAEDIFMNDMPVVPLYFSTQPIMMDKKVKDWRKSPLGFIYFSRAYIEK